MNGCHAVCVAHLGRDDLTTNKAYEYSTDEISQSLGMIHVINDRGVQMMYPSQWFSVIRCYRESTAKSVGQRRHGCLR